MPFDLQSAETLRRAVDQLPLLPTELITERKMFGGLCILLNGSILTAAMDTSYLMRLSDEDADRALALDRARPLDSSGRSMKHFVFIDPTSFAKPDDLATWLNLSLTYVREWQSLQTEKAPRAPRQRKARYM